MLEWLTGDIKKAVADIETLKTDLESAQALITKLSGGFLTATTELALLKQVLATAGINIPIIPLITAEQVEAFKAEAIKATQQKPQVKVSEPQ